MQDAELVPLHRLLKVAHRIVERLGRVHHVEHSSCSFPLAAFLLPSPRPPSPSFILHSLPLRGQGAAPRGPCGPRPAAAGAAFDRRSIRYRVRVLMVSRYFGHEKQGLMRELGEHRKKDLDLPV